MLDYVAEPDQIELIRRILDIVQRASAYVLALPGAPSRQRHDLFRGHAGASCLSSLHFHAPPHHCRSRIEHRARLRQDPVQFAARPAGKPSATRIHYRIRVVGRIRGRIEARQFRRMRNRILKIEGRRMQRNTRHPIRPAHRTRSLSDRENARAAARQRAQWARDHASDVPFRTRPSRSTWRPVSALNRRGQRRFLRKA